MAIVNVFDTGGLPQFRLPQARGQPAGVALRELTIDQEPEAFFKAQRREVRHLELLDQRLIHPGQFQGLELVESGMGQHPCSPLSSLYSVFKFFQVAITGIVRMTSYARYFKEGVGSSRPNWRWIMCFLEWPKANTWCNACVKLLSFS